MKKTFFTSAFTLVEVTVAIGIASVSLLGVVALLPMGITSNRDSVNTTHAASLVEAVVMDLRGVEGEDKSLRYGLSLNGEDSPSVLYFKTDGSKVSEAALADYRASVTISSSAAKFSPTMVRVVVSWPASAAVSNCYEALTAFEPKSN